MERCQGFVAVRPITAMTFSVAPPVYGRFTAAERALTDAAQRSPNSHDRPIDIGQTLSALSKRSAKHRYKNQAAITFKNMRPEYILIGRI